MGYFDVGKDIVFFPDAGTEIPKETLKISEFKIPAPHSGRFRGSGKGYVVDYEPRQLRFEDGMNANLFQGALIIARTGKSPHCDTPTKKREECKTCKKGIPPRVPPIKGRLCNPQTFQDEFTKLKPDYLKHQKTRNGWEKIDGELRTFFKARTRKRSSKQEQTVSKEESENQAPEEASRPYGTPPPKKKISGTFPGRCERSTPYRRAHSPSTQEIQDTAPE